MALLQFLFVATAAALDVSVTCGSAPKYFMMNGIANLPLTVVAGDTIFFNFDIGCTDSIQIQNFDGTIFLPGPITSLPTSIDTPSCLIYQSMTNPLTMTGTITVLGGMPCGAMVTPSTSLYNRPIIDSLPSVTLPPLYGNIYASASVSAALPPISACPILDCPAIDSCVAPSYIETNTLANGCPGCSYCYTPLPRPARSSIVLPPLVLPPLYCPVRSCAAPQCIFPSIQRTDIMADGCPGCPYCTGIPTAPCSDLSCLPCCPPIVMEGQLCRSCVAFY